MKPICQVLAAITVCYLLVPSPALGEPLGHAAAKSATVTTADWKTGLYTVQFRAGPFDYLAVRSFSSYEISRQLEGLSHPSSIVVESGISINSCRGVANKPDEWIKVYTSGSGKTLLIEESVPNDCGPCTNWILVRVIEGELVYEYLDLPVRSIDPKQIFPEEPRITRVLEQEISFEYSDGQKRTVAVKDLVKREKRPTFPG